MKQAQSRPRRSQFLAAGIVLALLVVAGLGILAARRPPTPRPQATSPGSSLAITVYKPPACGCCGDWIAHLKEHNFDVTVVLADDPAAIKARYHISPKLQSCHTAIINGYIIEGHVPAPDIKRFLAEQSTQAGLAVPGMPIGAPGMLVAGVAPQAYDVLTFDESGNTGVFAHYP